MQWYCKSLSLFFASNISRLDLSFLGIDRWASVFSNKKLSSAPGRVIGGHLTETWVTPQGHCATGDTVETSQAKACQNKRTSEQANKRK